MKWLQTFKIFELVNELKIVKPSAHVNIDAPRIADNKAFKDLVKKYDLKILTSPLQDKRGVVRFKSSIKEFRIGYDEKIYATDRFYTMYPTGAIRGETVGSFFNKDKVSQYVLFRLYPENLYHKNKLISSNEEINKMVEKIDKTIQFHIRKFLKVVEYCKKKIEKDPSFVVECPVEILAVINPKLANVSKLGIFEN